MNDPLWLERVEKELRTIELTLDGDYEADTSTARDLLDIAKELLEELKRLDAALFGVDEEEPS